MRVDCQHCSKSFTAWDDLAGQTVRCPKCGAETLLGGGSAPDETTSKASSSKASSKSDDLWDDNSASPASPKQGEAEVIAPPKQRDDEIIDLTDLDEIDSSFEPASSESPPPLASLPPAETGPAETSAPENRATEIPSTDTSLPTSSPSGQANPLTMPQTAWPEEVCPYCKARLPAAQMLCEACGYHKEKKRRLEAFIEAEIVEKEQEVGFRRWVQLELTDKASPDSVLIMLQVIAAAMLFLVLVPIGYFLGVCFVFVLIMTGVGTVAALYYFQGIVPNRGRVDRAIPSFYQWWSQFAWSTVLLLFRLFSWRDAEPPFQPRPAIILHDAATTDADVMTLPDLQDVRVLDLQGTSVTDAALEHLTRYRNLHFLIVRRTMVTDEGVERLQRRLPRLWIWK